jgi:hypothetical protein
VILNAVCGLRCGQIVVPTGFYARKHYPEKLRWIKFFDTVKDNRLNLLTNQMTLPALTIAQLYRCRWQVELFFKWIKQHLLQVLTETDCKNKITSGHIKLNLFES